MTNKLRIGVLGAGPIAQAAHLEACQKARNAELYAICDIAPDLLDYTSVVYQPQKKYLRYEDMLVDSEVDAVIVAVSDKFHVPMSIMALQAGKHVLVEKPVATTLEDALRLEQAVIDSGLTLQIGHMKRFDPGIAFAKSFIQDTMGDLLALKAWYCDSTHRYIMTDNVQPLIHKSPQARKPEADPKANKVQYYMLAHGSHLVDTARYLGGPMLSCQARLVEKFGAYSWFVDVEFANGANGHLDLTVAVRMDWHEGFQIYGEFGSVLGKTYNPWFYKSSDVLCFNEHDGQYHQVLGADAHTYRLQVEGFADVILNGGPMRGADVFEGTASVRALLAISQSVKTGQRVALDAVGGEIS
jgi:predicted dehydrogenase